MGMIEDFGDFRNWVRHSRAMWATPRTLHVLHRLMCGEAMRATLSRLMVVVLIILAIVPYADRLVAAGNQDPPYGKASPSEGTKAATGPETDNAADRKLLTAIEAAISAHGDHYDYSRLDRDLATAFRAFGLDLEAADPKTAGKRLSGRTATPEIAAAIDDWCRIRKTKLKVTTWRRLVEVAQAADPDRWRTAVRALDSTGRLSMRCRR